MRIASGLLKSKVKRSLLVLTLLFAACGGEAPQEGRYRADAAPDGDALTQRRDTRVQHNDAVAAYEDAATHDAATHDAAVASADQRVVAPPRCDSTPGRAFVMEHADRFTRGWTGAARALQRAGFDVASLPLDRPPNTLGAAIIVFGSFVSEDPRYKAYLEAYSSELRELVRCGAVLLQFTQADQTEVRPAFLPPDFQIRRTDLDLRELSIVAPQHLLTMSLAEPGRLDGAIVLPRHLRRSAIWENIAEQDGFRVLLAHGRDGQSPALLEGQHGHGRILLSSLFLDKLDSPSGDASVPSPVADTAAVFFGNLRRYVAAASRGELPDVEQTPPYQIPQAWPYVPGSTTVVVLPDTQMYVARYPQIFAKQTEWIADNAARLNIVHVVHLGDIVNNNGVAQWRIARDAMQTLDGVVPYALAIGNHDLGDRGSANNRETLFNDFFLWSELSATQTFGGAFTRGRLDNAYHLLEIGGRPWIVLALEWGPRDSVVDWASQVLQSFPQRQAILITHAYMYFDESRYDHLRRPDQNWNPYRYGTASLAGGTNDGEDLWQKLVSKHGNMRMVLNGHVLGDGLGRMSSLADHGNVVHQMLVNYQMHPEGGEGYLRLLEFLPDGTTVQVRTYSPHKDAFKTDSQNQFRLQLVGPS